MPEKPFGVEKRRCCGVGIGGVKIMAYNAFMGIDPLTSFCLLPVASFNR